MLGSNVPEAKNPAPLQKILTDPALWGKGFPSVLAYLPSWTRIDERSVAVSPDKVVGATRYSTPEAASAQVRKLTTALRGPKRKPSSEFADLLKPILGQPPPFQVTAVPLQEDDSVHVAWVGPQLELLAPGLTVETIQNRLGPPEKVTREIVQTEKDHRPVTLTLYRYAGGAVVFAESDLAPKPGVVDRVILNVRAVTTVVFGSR